MARSPLSRWLAIGCVGVVVLCGGGAGLALAVVSVLPAIPTRPAVVADLHPPIEDRTGRQLDPSRCGLNQVVTTRGCETAVATVVEEEVRFPSRLAHKGISELSGTLSIPEGLEGPRPGVVIVHGSGPNKRDGRSPGDLIARFNPPFEVYRTMAHELTRQGMVVLRYDKRTSMKGVDLASFAFSDFVDDARDALDFLASRPEVDASALVVLGHSQGGQLAPHIASGDERVAAVILMGGTTQTLGHLTIDQLERLGEVRKHQGDYLTQWLIELNARPMRKCYEPIWTGTYDPEQVCLAGVTQQALADYEALAERTGEVLASLHCPVMAIQGSCDINIDPLEIPRMRRLLEGRDAELHYVRGLDHSLTNQLEPSDPVAFDPEALRRIGGFLASVPWR